MTSEAVEYGRWFRFLLWLARRGCFRYDGLMGMHPRPMPMARVWYPDAQAYSVAMPLGNAVEYAERFNGKVVPNDF